MRLVEILERKDQGWCSSPECSLDDLRAMLRECETQQRGAMMPIDAELAAQSIRDEIARRDRLEKHQVLIACQNSIKQSLDHLSRPHWVLWATLGAGVIAALAAVILLGLALYRGA